MGRPSLPINLPLRENRVFQPEQLAHQDAFREAIAYAKTAKTLQPYIDKAEGTTKSSFNVAVADWFSKPVIMEIDTTGWTNGTTQTIRVKAQDIIFVANVQVEITSADGNILEQGDAVQAEGLWWEYTIREVSSDPSTLNVKATAQDLAGNKAAMAWQN